MKRTLFVLALASLSLSAFSQQQFKVKVENLGPQPLSPLFWSASNSSFDIFQVGGTASAGVKNIAERGRTVEMLGIANAAGSSISSYGALAGGPVVPGDMRMGMFTSDAAHPYFSFAAMLGKTNDGFIGEGVSSEGLKLFNGNVAQGFTYLVKGSNAWDAGTELNTQNAADLAFKGGTGNPADSDSTIRTHSGIVDGFGDSYADMPSWSSSTDLARITVTPVPEPASMTALALGVVALVRKRRQQS